MDWTKEANIKLQGCSAKTNSTNTEEKWSNIQVELCQTLADGYKTM